MKNIDLKSYQDSIKSIRDMNFKNFYSEMEKVTRNILKCCFEEDITFPINIRKVAESLEIEICERTLNLDIGFQLRKISGYIKEKGDYAARIYIDCGDSELIKRYMITHELSHYILGRMDTGEKQYCVEPFFPENQDEILADIMTACFLFPCTPVLKCMQMYVNGLNQKNDYPLNGEKWLNYLSKAAEVSYYHTVSSYQYVRYYMWALKDNLGKEYKEFFL